MLLCCHWQEFSKGQTSGTASWMRFPSLRTVYDGWLSSEVGIISLGQEGALSVGYNAFYGSPPYFRKVQNFGRQIIFQNSVSTHVAFCFCSLMSDLFWHLSTSVGF